MKKILALAVLGAIAAPAFADSGNVTIDGYVRAYYQRANDVAGGGASQNMINGRGEIHFAGSEDLGNGNSAIFKISSRFNSDGTEPDPTGVDSYAGTFGNATTYVGLKGSWGQMTLGNVADNFTDGKYSNGVILDESPRHSKIGSQHAANGAQKNSVRYDLPAMGGFTASGIVSMGEDKTTTTKANNVYTLRADYDADNWGVGAAYEGGRDSGDKYNNYDLTGAVKFGDFQVGLEYDAYKNKDTTRTNKTTGLYLNYAMDKWNFGLQFWRAKDKDAAGATSKASTYTLISNYALSKRTLAFAEYWSGKAKDSNLDYTADPHAARSFVIGLKHSF